MPRGRHRHSPPLHRLLPPLTVAGSAVALAVGAWFSPDGANAVIIRVLVAAAASVACAGAVLLRKWDRAAGKRVAEMTAARLRDEWRTDERIAELETDVEESREIRQRLENQLRARRGELSKLRGEHAALLRRYATAESERARVLESRRRLAIDAASAPRAAIGPGGADGHVGPTAYVKADDALSNLGRNAARQRALLAGEETRRHDAEQPPADEPEPASKLEPAQREPEQPESARPEPAPEPESAEPEQEPGREPREPLRADTDEKTPLPVREHRLVSAVSAAVMPYAQPQRGPGHRQTGGFDFFGLKKSSATEDLADVIGDEAHAEQDEHDGAEIIDLTAHDDTEQLDVRELRAQSQS